MSDQEKEVLVKPEVQSSALPSQDKVFNDDPAKDQVHSVDGILKKNKELLAELKAMKEDKKKLVESKLIEKEEFKTLAEQREHELNDWKSKYESTEKTVIDTIKLGALRKELSKLGLDAKYHDKVTRMVDLSKINYDTTNRVVTGVETLAQQLQQELPPLFGKSSVGVSHSAPSTPAGPLTLDDWKQLSPEDQAKRQPEVWEAMGIKRTK